MCPGGLRGHHCGCFVIGLEAGLRVSGVVLAGRVVLGCVVFHVFGVVVVLVGGVVLGLVPWPVGLGC